MLANVSMLFIPKYSQSIAFYVRPIMEKLFQQAYDWDPSHRNQVQATGWFARSLGV